VSYAVLGVVLLAAGIVAGRWLVRHCQPCSSCFRDSYAFYLASPQWRAVREARLHIDGYHCKGCGRKSGLHVHHLTYERLGHENAYTDLVTVCASCHKRIHDRHREMPGCSLAYVTLMYITGRVHA
jgi:phage terminase large subunit GpA-like protein